MLAGETARVEGQKGEQLSGPGSGQFVAVGVGDRDVAEDSDPPHRSPVVAV